MNKFQKRAENNLTVMDNIKELNNRKVPIVIIDPSLEKFRDQVLFPEKLAKANKMLKTAKLPDRKYQS